MSSIEVVMLRIRVFWDVAQHQLFLTFHRNVASILKAPCALEDRALHCLQMSVATYPATQLHILQWPLTQQHSFISYNGHLPNNTASHPTVATYPTTQLHVLQWPLTQQHSFTSYSGHLPSNRGSKNRLNFLGGVHR
jgi:hypothetical protein